MIPDDLDDAALRFPEDLLEADFGEEGALLFRLSDRVGRILNPTAVEIYKALRRGASTVGAAAALARDFGIDEARARADVDALVEDLVAEKLAGLGRAPEGIPPLPAGWTEMLEATMAEPEPAAPGGAPEPPEIPEDVVPRMTDADVILREEEEGAFLFEPETGELSCLNPVGIEVWKLLDGKRTLAGIVDAVVAAYEGVERDAVKRDVAAFLADLRAFGYVEWEAP